MLWQIEWDDKALNKFNKLDKGIRLRIAACIENKIKTYPKEFGKPMQYDYEGYWRYRVGDYRIICEIIKNKIIVRIIDVGHRKDIYDL